MVVDQNNLAKEQLSTLLDNDKLVLNHGPKIGKRHIQGLFIAMVVFMNYFIRNSMSVIIVAMTDPNSSSNKEIPTYNWTDKSLVVSAFMWGYMVTPIAAGYLATKYGSKWFLAGSLILSSSFGFLVPAAAAASVGSKGVMAIRVFQGICQGFMFPSIHAFLGKWVPVNERSRLGTLPYLGAPVGIVMAMLLSGYVAASPLGWPVALYIFNTAALLTGLVFAYLGCSDPDNHPSITEEEKCYIKSSLNSTPRGSTKDIPVPWLEIFTSLPFWAMMVAQFGGNWSHWTLLLETPIYMNHVMKFDLKSNSLISSMPYIAEFLSCFIFSVIADYLIIKKVCCIDTTRKIMNGISTIGSAVALLLLAYCDSKDAQKAVILLVFIGVVSAANKSGYNVNQIDLAPNFAGVLMGISNCFSTAASSVGPMIVHLLVKDENNPYQWRIIFYIAAILSIVTLIFNIIFASGSVQPWNHGSRKFREEQEGLSVKA